MANTCSCGIFGMRLVPDTCSWLFPQRSPLRHVVGCNVVCVFQMGLGGRSWSLRKRAMPRKGLGRGITLPSVTAFTCTLIPCCTYELIICSLSGLLAIKISLGSDQHGDRVKESWFCRIPSKQPARQEMRPNISYPGQPSTSPAFYPAMCESPVFASPEPSSGKQKERRIIRMRHAVGVGAPVAFSGNTISKPP